MIKLLKEFLFGPSLKNQFQEIIETDLPEVVEPVKKTRRPRAKKENNK